jgi:hypothetical protein
MTESLESEMPSPVINASASDDGRVVGIYRFLVGLFFREVVPWSAARLVSRRYSIRVSCDAFSETASVTRNKLNNDGLLRPVIERNVCVCVTG